MTALNVAELRLPHRRHETLPADPRDHREWAIEEAVWLFTEYGETSLLDLVRVLHLFAMPVDDFAAETDIALAIVTDMTKPTPPADELAARRGVRA